MTKFFKKLKKNYFVTILGPLCPNLRKKIFSWKKGLCQFLNIPIMYHCEKESEKNDEPILRKMLIRVRVLFLPADNNSSLKTEDTTLSSN